MHHISLSHSLPFSTHTDYTTVQGLAQNIVMAREERTCDGNLWAKDTQDCLSLSSFIQWSRFLNLILPSGRRRVPSCPSLFHPSLVSTRWPNREIGRTKRCAISCICPALSFSLSLSLSHPLAPPGTIRKVSSTPCFLLNRSSCSMWCVCCGKSVRLP